MTLLDISLVAALLASPGSDSGEKQPVVAAIAYTGNAPPDADDDCDMFTDYTLDRETCEVEALVRDAALRGAQILVVSEGAFETESAESLPKKGRRPDAKTAPVLERMSNISAELEIYLAVPLHTVDESGALHSSLVAFGPNGTTAGIHHKVELYSTERDEFEPGGHFGTFWTPWGRITMMLCSDVYAAPELHTTLKKTNSDIVLLSSLWTVEDSRKWQSAFAHDWGVYLVAANGAGGQSRGSGIYDRDGSPIVSDNSGADTALVASLRN